MTTSTQRQNLFLSLIFLSVYSYASFFIYDITLFKVITLLGGLLTFLLWNGLRSFLSKSDSNITNKPPYTLWLWLSLPLLLSLPGWILNQTNGNYYATYLLAQHLLLLIWAGFVCQNLNANKNIDWIHSLIGFVTIYVGVGFLLELYGINFLIPVDKSIDRGVTVFGNVNFLASFLAMSIPVLVSKLLSLKVSPLHTRYNKLFYSVAVLVGIIVLIKTQTRAAQFACVTACLATLMLGAVALKSQLIQKRILFITIVLITTLTVGAVLFYFSPDLFPTRYQQTFSSRSLQGRLQLWHAATNSFLDSPIYGHGLGSYYNQYFSHITPDSRLYFNERSFKHAHNIFLEWANDGGTLSLLGLLGFLGYLFKMICSKLNSSTTTVQEKLHLSGLTGGMLAYFIHNSFSLSHQRIGVQLLWVTLAATTYYLATPSLALSKNRGTKNIFIKTTFIIISAALIYPWATGFYHFKQIISEPVSLARVSRLQSHFSHSKNIHALNQLAYDQINAKQFNELLNTIHQTQSIIPHYRRADFLEASVYYFQGNLEQAQKLALEFQKRDKYELGNMQLLTRIAIKEKNQTLLLKQVTLLLEYLFIWNHIDQITTPDQIVVTLDSKSNSKNIRFRKQDNKIIVSISPQWINFIFTKLEPSSNKNETILAKEVFSSMVSTIENQTFFKVSKGRVSIIKTLAVWLSSSANPEHDFINSAP